MWQAENATVQGESSGGTPGRGSLWTVFAGLQLFLFVFFVYLAGTTHPDATRTELALSSVRDAFAPHRTLPGVEGPFEAGASVLAELGGDLAARIRLARVQGSSRGGDVTLVLPSAELFPPRQQQPRDMAIPLLDRTVAALSAPPTGQRLLLTVTLNGDEDDAENQLAIGRAAALAATLLARGAPPDVLAVGLGPVERGFIRLSFRLSSLTHTREKTR